MPSHLHLRNKESVTSALESARRFDKSPRSSENTEREDESFLLDQSSFGVSTIRARRNRLLQPKNICIAILAMLVILLSLKVVAPGELAKPAIVQGAAEGPSEAGQIGSDIPKGALTSATTDHEGRPRRAVIIASYTGQNTDWTEEVPKDWEIYRYENNNPMANLTVPRNQGREAMSYLTYLIDNYDDLPNYMLFFHGHYKSWHQLGPTPELIKNLNLSAVDAEGWVSLRCGWEPSCSPPETWLNTTGPHPGHHPVVPILPHFFRYLFPNEEEVPMPPIFAAPCCAQFAVSRQAALSRSKEFWTKARAPLLRDLTEFRSWGEEFDTWHSGVLYERMWHYFFGKPAFHCVPEEQCLSDFYQGRF